MQMPPKMLRAMRAFLHENDMMAYLAMMAVRLLELHRVLKPTGSLYLHCDPTASHFLKILLDAVFGPRNFRNEIIWRRTNSHNKLSQQYGPIHDSILFYSKGPGITFHPGRRPYLKGYVSEYFPYTDAKGRYQSNVLTGAGVRTGASGKPWGNYNPTPKGRHWAIPAKLLDELPAEDRAKPTQELLDLLDERGLILHPKGEDSLPRYKQYLSSSDGLLYQDVWTYQSGTKGLLENSPEGIDEDVKWLDDDDERMGYPTQKPVGLLDRIIRTSSNEGDVVLDPFCGCGTTVHAAQKLSRQWIGIDITHLAISLIQKRLRDAFPLIQIEIIGVPKDLDGARALAAQDKYQFQWWAVSLVDAVPYGGKKKGADTGIDGFIYFKPDGKRTEKAIVSVKGGENVGVQMIRELANVVDREKAKMGLLITLAEPTANMRKEAVSSGYFRTEAQGDFAKIQIVTIEELLGGKKPHLPWAAPDVFRRAKREMKGMQEKLL